MLLDKIVVNAAVGGGYYRNVDTFQQFLCQGRLS